jgi:hypothetical protein
MRKILFAIPMILLVLGACGQAAPQASQPTTAPAGGTTPPAPTIAQTTPPAPTAAPTLPTALPTSAPLPATSSGAPTPGGDGTSVRPLDALVTTAQQRLAQHLGVSADTLMLQSANHQEWPDGAIGCPKPGHLYPQVITPGFLLIFSNQSQSQTYEIHTGRNEQQMVLCENKQPIDLPAK